MLIIVRRPYHAARPFKRRCSRILLCDIRFVDSYAQLPNGINKPTPAPAKPHFTLSP